MTEQGASPIPTPPQVTKEETSLKQVELGDPEIFVKLTPEGKLIAAKTKIRLREELGHLYEVKGKVQISSLGFHAMNAYASVSLVGPRQILMPDGKSVVNPYLERDEKTGHIKVVWVRRVAFGLSPIGTLCVVDRTLCYDLRTQLLEEVVKKVSKNPQYGSFMKEESVAAHEAQSGKKGWFLLVEPPVGVWVDLSQKEIMEVLETHTQRLRFAERIATTICERNALRSHPAIGKTQVSPIGDKASGKRYAEVYVIGFRHDLDRKRMESLAMSIASDEVDQVRAQAEAITGAPVDRDVKEDVAVGEEIAHEETAAVNGEVVEAQEVPPPEPTEAPAVDVGKEATHRQKLLAQIKQARAALGDEPGFFKIMKQLGITTSISESPDELLDRLNKAVSQEVDRRAQKK